MKICDDCHRHVRPSEGVCPFCGRSLRTTGATRLGAVVLLGALEVGCSGRPLEETASDSSVISSTTSTSTSSSSGDTPMTSSTTTSAASTTSATTDVTTTVASSTGELSSTGDPDTSDSGCSFYGGCPSDFGNPLLCDVWTQDCPPGQKCMPFSGDGDNQAESADCSPVAPNPGKPGEPCTVEGSPASGIDSCDGTSMCFYVDSQTLEGECIAFCTGSPDAPICGADQACVSFGIGEVVNLCVPTCDPLMPACAPDQVCVSSPQDNDKFVCVIDASGDGGALFEPCDFANACDLGLFCAGSELATECDPNEPGCCLPYCAVDMPMCTAAGAECVSWYEMGQAPAGLENLGACILPP